MHDLWLVIIIAVSLAMDCFAVSLGIGSSPLPVRWRTVLRLAFHFGLFQGGMTLIGWLIGQTILPFIENYDHWVAFAFLGWIGFRMIREGISNNTEILLEDPTRGKSLVMLSVATSIDALGVGLSLQVIDFDIFYSSFIIGITSLLLSVIGLKFGKYLSRKFGKGVEILGGLILIAIGVRLVITHIWV